MVSVEAMYIVGLAHIFIVEQIYPYTVLLTAVICYFVRYSIDICQTLKAEHYGYKLSKH